MCELILRILKLSGATRFQLLKVLVLVEGTRFP